MSTPKDPVSGATQPHRQGGSDETTVEPVPNGSTDDFTTLLAAADAGEPDAWRRIYDLLYPDLHRIARSQVRRQLQPQLSPTSLVSETWLKLSGARLEVENRRHLIALIGRAMRFVLLDETRRALTAARADPDKAVPLPDDLSGSPSEQRLERLLELDHALTRLAGIDQRLARVVELRYFTGLTEPEVAEALGLTERTISRDWRRARAYLLQQIGPDDHTRSTS
ncbi:MAG: sigma-70 family RNA polymerase sigma factor [Xanthomonadales bacterium]|nr:sigma-70 family RNA polymerase sigma factor [Xanthomonadales bacterium]